MRTFGRTRDVLTGKKTWHVVTTDSRGFNDMVYLTTLAQVLKLNINESPFFADWGLPARDSVINQIAPDYNVALTAQRFQSRFMSLSLMRMPDAVDETGRPAPCYNISVVTHWGSIIEVNVPV